MGEAEESFPETGQERKLKGKEMGGEVFWNYE